MAKKIVVDEVYGKIKYNEDEWKKTEEIEFVFGKVKQSVKCEIEIYNSIYEELKLGLFDEEDTIFWRNKPEITEPEKSEEIAKKQKELYKVFLNNISDIVINMKEAAIEECDNMVNGREFAELKKMFGKDKAERIFKYKSDEDKLESIRFCKMRVFSDRIEMTCTCDWYKPSGGFIIMGDKSVIMRPLDSLSI